MNFPWAAVWPFIRHRGTNGSVYQLANQDSLAEVVFMATLPTKMKSRNTLLIVGFAIMVFLQVALSTQVVYCNNTAAREMQKRDEEIERLKRDIDFLRGEREKREAEHGR